VHPIPRNKSAPADRSSSGTNPSCTADSIVRQEDPVYDPTGSFGTGARRARRRSNARRESCPRDPATCRLDDLVREVTERVSDEWQICVVTNDDNVVLGLLGQRALRCGENIHAEEAMTADPQTGGSVSDAREEWGRQRRTRSCRRPTGEGPCSHSRTADGRPGSCFAYQGHRAKPETRTTASAPRCPAGPLDQAVCGPLKGAGGLRSLEAAAQEMHVELKRSIEKATRGNSVFAFDLPGQVAPAAQTLWRELLPSPSRASHFGHPMEPVRASYALVRSRRDIPPRSLRSSPRRTGTPPLWWTSAD